MIDLTAIRKGLYEAKCLLEDRVPMRYRGMALNAVEGAIDVLNSDMNFVWHKFRKDTMPDKNQQLLVWLDYQQYGFPVCAIMSGDKLFYWNCHGTEELLVTPGKGEFAHALWAYIPTPAGEIPTPAPCSFPGADRADADLTKVGDGVDHPV